MMRITNVELYLSEILEAIRSRKLKVDVAVRQVGRDYLSSGAIERREVTLFVEGNPTIRGASQMEIAERMMLYWTDECERLSKAAKSKT